MEAKSSVVNDSSPVRCLSVSLISQAKLFYTVKICLSICAKNIHSGIKVALGFHNYRFSIIIYIRGDSLPGSLYRKRVLITLASIFRPPLVFNAFFTGLLLGVIGLLSTGMLPRVIALCGLLNGSELSGASSDDKITALTSLVGAGAIPISVLLNI